MISRGLASIVVAMAGCATGGAGGAGSGDRLSLELGTSLTTMLVDPPSLVGNAGALVIKDDLIQGPGGVRLRFEGNGAEGSGPAGPAMLWFKEDPAGIVEIAGTWNGAPVNVRLTPALLDAKYRRGGNDFCEAKLERGAPGEPLVGPASCGGDMYFAGGARLEIPPALEAWLTSRQLAAVLLVLLSQASFPSDSPMPGAAQGEHQMQGGAGVTGIPGADPDP